MNGASKSTRQVISLVGPAGVGKSTLLHELTRRCPDLVVAPKIGSERLRFAPQIVRNALRLSPLLPKLHGDRAALRVMEFKWMVYLETLYQWVQERSGTVLMDEGAVYMLGRLHLTGAPVVRSAALESWWSETTGRWARTVDLVVMLDAPDVVLAERIHTREKQHVMKHRPDAAVADFLRGYRDSYEYVLSRLQNGTGPQVLRLDTSQHSSPAMADLLLERLREPSYA